MKLGKRLMLGSAAGLVVMSGAQAADLPVKAKAVEYVKVCSLYGAGFWYIPGTDTCIKLGGYLRADVVFNGNTDATGNVFGQGGAKNRFTNYFTTRARQDLSVDTRTATEYGVVRTFAEFTLSWTTDSYSGTGTGSTVYSSIGGVSAPNNANSGAVAGGTLGVYYAYIQFAGFTIGKAISEFSMPWTNYPGNNFDGLVGGGGDVTGVDQLTYTAQFGNGVSAAISLQDPTAYYQAGVNNFSIGGAFGTSAYGGTRAPDIIGTVTVDQAWGLFKFSAAAHDNHVAYYAPGNELAGHPDDKWGFAVQAGLTIKNIPTGPGDTLNVSGVYTDGATRYNIQDLAAGYGAVSIYGNTGLLGAYQSVALAAAPDTVYANGLSQHTIQTWGMRGAFNHNWDPYWSSSLYGAFASVRYGSMGQALVCNSPSLGLPALGLSALAAAGGTITSCNPNYDIGQLGFITRWTPVKNLTFSADVTWSHIDQKMTGTIDAANAAIGKPVGAYEFKNQDNVTLLTRVQRNF